MKGDALRVSAPSWDTPLMHPRTALPPWGLPRDAPQVSSFAQCGVWSGAKGRGVRNLAMPLSGLGSVHTVPPEKRQLQPCGEPWLCSKSLLATIPTPLTSVGMWGLSVLGREQRALLTQNLLVVICLIPNLLGMVTKGKLAKQGGKVTRWVSCPV